MPPTVRAPRGTQISCRGWPQEAALRMLMNNLDPEVAERPADLVVYGGRGQAARNWECYEAIVRTLRELADDETLLVQSGKPVAVFRTHRDAPRVLIANSNLVPHWATQTHFDELAAKGLMMFGQMTAGSWIYIGTQGILQGTYETFAAAARAIGATSLRGKFVLSAGLGGMGGAQPLAITMNDGVGLIVEVDPARAKRRLETKYVDVVVDTLEEAMTLVDELRARREPRSIGLIGNAAQVYAELAARGSIPDVVTDQTPAHDVLMYVPEGLGVEAAAELRKRAPTEYEAMSMKSMAQHVRAMLEFKRRGAEVFDYGNNLRQRALRRRRERCLRVPGLRARPTSARCSAKARGRFAGWRSRATRRISTAPMKRSCSSSRKMSTCTAGCTWRASGSPSRGCRRASAGWATASAPRPGCASTRWSRAAR